MPNLAHTMLHSVFKTPTPVHSTMCRVTGFTILIVTCISVSWGKSGHIAAHRGMADTEVRISGAISSAVTKECARIAFCAADV